MGDVISTIKHISNGSAGTGMIMTDIQRIPFYSSLKLKDSYYFRLIVDDVTGVLASIARIFADNDISINEVVQKRRFEKFAELMLIVDTSPRENILRVEDALKNLPTVKSIANIIRVMNDDKK